MTAVTVGAFVAALEIGIPDTFVSSSRRYHNDQEPWSKMQYERASDVTKRRSR